MKKYGACSSRIMSYLFIALILLPGWATGAEPGAKIAFANLEKMFERYQKTKDLTTRWEQETKEKLTKRKRMVDEINKLKDEADLLRDEAKRKKEELVDEKVKELYQYGEKIKREAIKREARFKAEILGEIHEVLVEIGSKEDYDAIFPFTEEDIGYHAPALDITDQVVRALDEKYRKGK